MNKLFLSTLIVSCFFIDSLGQTITVNFFPAFLNPSVAIFCFHGDSCRIDLSISDKNNKSIVWSEKKFIKNESLNWFNSFFNDTSNLSDKKSIGLDGITINGKYIDGNELKEFNFWSPGRGSNQHLFFKMTLEILSKSMDAHLSKRYLKYLRKYLN